MTNGHNVACVTLALDKVPEEVARCIIDGLNLVLQTGHGRVEIEVRDKRIFVRPQPSHEFTALGQRA